MKTFREIKEQIARLTEALSPSDPIEKWIEDFVTSSDEKFDGKSKEKRAEMAKAAYYAAQPKNESVDLQRDIADLRKMIANPDPSRVREYGGTTYVDMLKAKLKNKLAKLRSENVNEATVSDNHGHKYDVEIEKKGGKTLVWLVKPNGSKVPSGWDLASVKNKDKVFIDMGQKWYVTGLSKALSSIKESTNSADLARMISRFATIELAGSDKTQFMNIASMLRRGDRDGAIAAAKKLSKVVKGDAHDELLFMLTALDESSETEIDEMGYPKKLQAQIERIKNSTLSHEAKKAAITTLVNRFRATHEELDEALEKRPELTPEFEKAWKSAGKAQKAALLKKHDVQSAFSKARGGDVKLGIRNALQSNPDKKMLAVDDEGRLLYVTGKPMKIHYV